MTNAEFVEFGDQIKCIFRAWDYRYLKGKGVQEGWMLFK